MIGVLARRVIKGKRNAGDSSFPMVDPCSLDRAQDLSAILFTFVSVASVWKS